MLEVLIEFLPPEIIWIGHEISINCSVSTIYFAYGTEIYDKSSDSGNYSQG
jgi:hypothetical protein